jgi:uncharacterized phage protein (TIGR02218 family)
MKTLGPGLAAHLSGRVTTLATCWTLTRRDGVVLGFTDHDRPLVLDGVTHEAATGLSTSSDVAAAGLAVGGREVAGALSSAAIDAGDIDAGLYDGATVSVRKVDWSNPADAVEVRRGTLGEVTRADGAFRAEIRSLARALDEPRGRLFQHRCDADLGDVRCGVDLAAPALKAAGTVTAAPDRRRFLATGLGGRPAGYFAEGRVAFTRGANAGLAMEVKLHLAAGATAELELWQPMPRAITAGDTFTVTAGCDKRWQTCRARFDNQVNFRGFPHMPGNDFLLTHPSRSRTVRDGGTLVE